MSLKLKAVLVGCALVASGFVVFNAPGGDVTAHEKAISHVGTSREIARLKREIAMLRRRPERRSPGKEQSRLDSCYAKSESEAEEKMLTRLAQEEDAQVDSEFSDDKTSKLLKQPRRMGVYLCEEGISDEERLTIATDLSSRLARWKFAPYRAIESTDPDHENEHAHAIIKKHLGEKRYLDQVIKCATSNDNTESASVSRRVGFFGDILGLSEGQRAEVLRILEDYSDFGKPHQIPLLDEAGRWVELNLADITGVDAPGVRETRAPDESEAEADPYIYGKRLRAVLTPEQLRRYRELVHDESGVALTLLGNMIGLSEDTSEAPSETPAASPESENEERAR